MCNLNSFYVTLETFVNNAADLGKLKYPPCEILMYFRMRSNNPISNANGFKVAYRI